MSVLLGPALSAPWKCRTSLSVARARSRSLSRTSSLSLPPRRMESAPGALVSPHAIGLVRQGPTFWLLNLPSRSHLVKKGAGRFNVQGYWIRNTSGLEKRHSWLDLVSSPPLPAGPPSDYAPFANTKVWFLVRTEGGRGATRLPPEQPPSTRSFSRLRLGPICPVRVEVDRRRGPSVVVAILAHTYSH